MDKGSGQKRDEVLAKRMAICFWQLDNRFERLLAPSKQESAMSFARIARRSAVGLFAQFTLTVWWGVVEGVCRVGVRKDDVLCE